MSARSSTPTRTSACRAYQSLAHETGDVVVERDDVPAGGWYVGPDGHRHRRRPFTGSRPTRSSGRCSRCCAPGDFDHAIALANDTDYALTAGVFSRTPSRIAQATGTLRAGNVYVNRGITGAVVGRQPFGGYGLSGVGSKAGGPDYLLQFVEPRVVTENTIRQGFAPPPDDGEATPQA